VRAVTIIAIGVILAFSRLAPANAENCQPKDFTVQDLQKLNFSDSIKYSGYSVLDQSKNENKNQGVSGSTVYEGAPVSLSWADAKSLSEHMLEYSGFNFDHNTKLNYIRTALSSTGAEMYHDCLGAQRIQIDISPAAYKDRSFTLGVKWTPDQNTPSPENGRILIDVKGGSINGKKSLQKGAAIRKSVWEHYDIDRPIQSHETLQIDVAVFGDKYPTIEIPPLIALKKFKFVKRIGLSKTPYPGPYYECTDHASLVSGVGSVAGPFCKELLPLHFCVT
jgi:hypothetical protein